LINPELTPNLAIKIALSNLLEIEHRPSTYSTLPIEEGINSELKTYSHILSFHLRANSL